MGKLYYTQLQCIIYQLLFFQTSIVHLQIYIRLTLAFNTRSIKLKKLTNFKFFVLLEIHKEYLTQYLNFYNMLYIFNKLKV